MLYLSIMCDDKIYVIILIDFGIVEILFNKVELLDLIFYLLFRVLI